MPGLGLCRLRFSSALSRVSTINIADPATDARPSRTPTRQGIAPFAQAITLIHADEPSGVQFEVQGGFIIGGVVVWQPNYAAEGMAQKLEFHWAEKPGPITAPPLSVDPLTARCLFTLHTRHEGPWRLCARLRSATVDLGGLNLPFLVQVRASL